MNDFMRRAVEIAADNVRAGGEPFGAVLVKNGEVIAEGVNELHIKYDITGHAELVAIRKAQVKLETYDLSEFTMYASGMPCPMCLTTMYYSGLTNIYYAATIEETADAGLDASKVIYADLTKPNEARNIVMKHMPLEENQENPMQMWKEAKQNG